MVAHYTKRGSEDTAVEIDKVGQGGLKAARGTVTEIDRGGRKLVVDTGTGAKETFELTDHASVFVKRRMAGNFRRFLPMLCDTTSQLLR